MPVSVHRVSIYDYVRILFQRKWYIIITTIFFICVAVIFVYVFADEVYQADNQYSVSYKLSAPLTQKITTTEPFLLRLSQVVTSLKQEKEREKVIDAAIEEAGQKGLSYVLCKVSTNARQFMKAGTTNRIAWMA